MSGIIQKSQVSPAETGLYYFPSVQATQEILTGDYGFKLEVLFYLGFDLYDTGDTKPIISFDSVFCEIGENNTFDIYANSIKVKSFTISDTSELSSHIFKFEYNKNNLTAKISFDENSEFITITKPIGVDAALTIMDNSHFFYLTHIKITPS